MYKGEEVDHQAKMASLKEDLLEGKASKFLLALASTLLVGAIYASYTASGRLATIEAKIDNVTESQLELRARILYLERGRVIDNRKYDREHRGK